MMADNLKPCPFCGGEPLKSRVLRDGCIDGEPDAWAYSIRCRSCAADGGWAKSEHGAERLWNRRASPWRNSQQEPPPKEEAWMLGRSKLTGIDLFRWCPVDEEWLDGTDMPSERPDWWMPIPPLEGS